MGVDEGIGMALAMDLLVETLQRIPQREET